MMSFGFDSLEPASSAPPADSPYKILSKPQSTLVKPTTQQPLKPLSHNRQMFHHAQRVSGLLGGELSTAMGRNAR